VILAAGCSEEKKAEEEAEGRTVPHEDTWGIYSLDLASEDVELIYGSSMEISKLDLSPSGDSFAFYQKLDGEADEHEEICSLAVEGTDFQRLTNNHVRDVYPKWSPNGTQIAFLTWRDSGLDIYVMDSDGGNQELLYDSGSHDADIDWVGDMIVFTRDSQIWIMGDDGTGATQLTDPPRAAEWGEAVLPFGDYDPRLSPDGSKIVFERMVDDSSQHGNYDLYLMNSDGSGEVALSNSGYTQGLVSWSPSGDRMAYLVSAMGEEGLYHIYVMNSDGTDNRDVTPDYFPAGFLCHSPVFSEDGSQIYFVGQWWE
jgi:TolB protein